MNYSTNAQNTFLKTYQKAWLFGIVFLAVVFLGTFGEPTKVEAQTNSINVCVAVTDSDGKIAIGYTWSSTFQIKGGSPSPAATSPTPAVNLPVTNFVAPPTVASPLTHDFFDNNGNIGPADGVLDTTCVLLPGLVSGGTNYYHNNMIISSPTPGVWSTPLLNDSFSAAITYANFFSYTDFWFDADISNDGTGEANSDGRIRLDSNRTLIFLSQLTECADGADNDGDGFIDTDDPGCHTDGDPSNPITYVPSDDDEYNCLMSRNISITEI